MTVKQLIISIKHGANTRFLMDKYGFETAEELFQAIRKMTPSGADKFIRQLRCNDKRATKVEDEVDIELDVKVDVEVDTEADTEAGADVEGDAEGDAEAESKVDTDELCQLEQDESELSNILCSLEGKHKDLVCERGQITCCIREIEKRFEDILQEIDRLNAETTTHMNRFYVLGNQMRTLDQEMSDYRSLLDDIRARMEELKQVFILVSSNGIEVENAEIPFIRDEDVSLKTDALLHHEAADELTVREIKTVAKLLLMVGSFEKYELMFDNSRMETFFEQVKSFAS